MMSSKSWRKIHSTEYGAAVSLVTRQHVHISNSRGAVGKRCSGTGKRHPQAFSSRVTKGSPPPPHLDKVGFCAYFRFYLSAGNLDIIPP